MSQDIDKEVAELLAYAYSPADRVTRVAAWARNREAVWDARNRENIITMAAEIQHLESKLAAAQAEAKAARIDKGELWSWTRHVLEQGSAIQQDYASGKYKCYEEFSARVDAAARERADEFTNAIAAALAEREKAKP